MTSTTPLTGKRVAIVEDEGIIVLQLTKALTRAGLQVVGHANDAQGGIDMVLQERPDLVLMDINLPGDLNGLDAAEAILAVYPVCVVILSAYSADEFRERVAGFSACGYIAKPIASDKLIPELERAMSNWSQARS